MNQADYKHAKGARWPKCICAHKRRNHHGGELFDVAGQCLICDCNVYRPNVKAPPPGKREGG
mgnify:CR=1 FL=1